MDRSLLTSISFRLAPGNQRIPFRITCSLSMRGLRLSHFPQDVKRLAGLRRLWKI
jgi:hypothetical protein